MTSAEKFAHFDATYGSTGNPRYYWQLLMDSANTRPISTMLIAARNLPMSPEHTGLSHKSFMDFLSLIELSIDQFSWVDLIDRYDRIRVDSLNKTQLYNARQKVAKATISLALRGDWRNIKTLIVRAEHIRLADDCIKNYPF